MTHLFEYSPKENVRIARIRTFYEAAPPSVSFAMPAWNEEDNIERTIGECVAAFSKAGIASSPSDIESAGGNWGEIVVTNDCSKDKTGEILKRLQDEHQNLVIVTHDGKNQGYGRALSDAIESSRGIWVATIDSDGQFNPENLPDLLKKTSDTFSTFR